MSNVTTSVRTSRSVPTAMTIAITAALGALGACKSPPPATDAPATSAAPAATTTTAAAPANAAPAEVAGPARVGQPAPDFALKDLEGHEVKLSSFKGKTVVLEWFNPGCPYVKAAHSKGSLKEAAKTHTAKGVVWLAINSGAPGKQGHGVEANKAGVSAFGLSHPVLLDESGQTGRAYGATNTPHMFVVDPSGVLVYRGAVDNSPDGEGESAPDGKLLKYVDLALADLAALKPVGVAETKAYGCSVKYGH